MKKNIEINVAPSGNDFTVCWKGKPLKTEGGNALILPTEALAEAIAGEWRAQDLPKRKPETMPLHGLACLALDVATPTRDKLMGEIQQFAETDTLCYRDEAGSVLCLRQQEHWQPWLLWGNEKLGVTWNVTQGIMPVEQPETLKQAVHNVLDPLTAFHLTVLMEATRLTGSFLLGLAFWEGEITAEQAYELGCLEVLYQREQWGEDEEATARLTHIHSQLAHTEMFRNLLGA